MADNLKLAAGLRNLPASARQDLAQREEDIQRGKTVELLRRAGKEMYENPIVNTAIGMSPVLGDIQAGVEAYRSAQAGDWGNAGLNAVGMLPFVPALAGTFVGKGSKTWDAIQAAEAAKRLESGENAAQIWKETGYGVAPWDKQMRSEISDVGATINPNIDVIHGYGVSTDKEITSAERLKEANDLIKEGFSPEKIYKITGYKDTGKGLEDLYVNPYASVIEHKELGMAYPSLENLKTEIAQKQGNIGGYYDPNKDLIRLYSADEAWNKLPQTRSDMLHELTHAVQTREGFARGGSTSEIASEIADADERIVKINKTMDAMSRSMDAAKASGDTAKYDKYRKLYDEAMDFKLNELVPIANQDPYQSYRSLAGEAEARLVQARRDMTPEQLAAQYPYDPAYFKEATGVPIESLITRFDDADLINKPNNQPIAQALRDYRGSHTAPGPEFGAPLHDLTGGGQMYPEDVYSRNAVQYYGTGDTKLDKESFALAQRMRNKPEEMIDIYRAVPNEGDITSINAGDWVTINPNYAKQHGESNLPEGYKILQQKVPVKSVWTNADSIHEYGYWPE